jgi:hypothetical protein
VHRLLGQQGECGAAYVAAPHPLPPAAATAAPAGTARATETTGAERAGPSAAEAELAAETTARRARGTRGTGLSPAVPVLPVAVATLAVSLPLFVTVLIVTVLVTTVAVRTVATAVSAVITVSAMTPVIAVTSGTGSGSAAVLLTAPIVPARCRFGTVGRWSIWRRYFALVGRLVGPLRFRVEDLTLGLHEGFAQPGSVLVGELGHRLDDFVGNPRVEVAQPSE